MAAVLRRARAFVGNDNGPMHIAAALGTPVVALFGPSDPQEWGPRGAGHRVIYKEGYCTPCIHPRCVRGEQNCLRVITVDEVAEAVRALIGRAAAGLPSR
jgi:ADP-heptose:LPS heptosyltransferase